MRLDSQTSARPLGNFGCQVAHQAAATATAEDVVGHADVHLGDGGGVQAAHHGQPGQDRFCVAKLPRKENCPQLANSDTLIATLPAQI